MYHPADEPEATLDGPWALAGLVLTTTGAWAQNDMRQRSTAAEKQGLAVPFKGVTADGTLVSNLFAITSTGVSTEPVRKAAEAFLGALTAEQRARTAFGLDDDEWRKWINQHFYVRQGVSFQELWRYLPTTSLPPFSGTPDKTWQPPPDEGCHPSLARLRCRPQLTGP